MSEKYARLHVPAIKSIHRRLKLGSLSCISPTSAEQLNPFAEEENRPLTILPDTSTGTPAKSPA
jgi:hypothetical protein